MRRIPSSRAVSNRTSAKPRAMSSGSNKCFRCWAKKLNRSTPAIDGIIDEAEDVTGEVDDKDVLDAAIIAAGQAVEHYEITRYGSLIAWARRFGRSDVANLLEQTLNEEKAADKKLTTIAESKVNHKAA